MLYVVSLCGHVFAAGGDVSFEGIAAGRHWPIRTGQRRKQLTEKGRIVLNGRKEVFTHEASGSGGAAPCGAMAKMGEEKK